MRCDSGRRTSTLLLRFPEPFRPVIHRVTLFRSGIEGRIGRWAGFLRERVGGWARLILTQRLRFTQPFWSVVIGIVHFLLLSRAGNADF